MKNRALILELENRNAELSKEILLNETATYDSEKEIELIDAQLRQHPKIQQYVKNLQLLMKKIDAQNQEYKNEIFENDLKISRLKNDEGG